MDPAMGHGSTDTIVAQGTAPGRAALAMIRLSGPDTRAVLERAFEPARAGEWVAWQARLGTVLDSAGGALDSGIALLYEAPSSYTGEDMAEVSLHGAPPVVRAAMEAMREAGARLAEPGEFTRRAVEHGKMDLTQAEGVRDLVEASTLEQARIAARQLGGEVSTALHPAADELVDLLADVEADLDFSEDEALGAPASEIASRSRELAAWLQQLASASRPAARIKEGARVALLGPPNAGKSSLFNSLLGSERAIVTREPGTTRDTVEELTELDGLPVVLIDGAGIADPRGLADEEAQRRARRAAETADLVLEVRSLTSPSDPDPAPGPEALLVLTHLDQLPDTEPPASGIAVSNLTGEGITQLREEIARRLEAPGAGSYDTVALASERHRDRAMEAHAALTRAADLAEGGEPLELCAIELRRAATALQEILGHVGPEELLGRIFARFCVGK
jgi:tRNA modification GTPase